MTPEDPSSPVVLVTGANGFVGSHLVDLLLERGHRVRCLVRKTSRLDWLATQRVELVYGEVSDPSSLPPALEGVGWVLHSAGQTLASKEEDYLRVNAEGAAHLLAAARASGAERFVLVSSLAAAGPSDPQRPRSEDDPSAPTSLYGKSKLAGERAVREGAGDLPWTIVRPPAVYGPRDAAVLKLFRIVRRRAFPRPRGVNQKLSIIHVRDLCEGILAAAASSTAVGRTYFLSHPTPATWETIVELAAGAMGVRPRILDVPRWVFPATARLFGAVEAVRGRTNPFPTDRVRDLLAEAWTCDESRAAQELGFHAETNLEAGLAETHGWYRSHGWL